MTSSATLSGDSHKTQKLAEELEKTKLHLALSEDLTGFSVVSVKSEDNGEVYSAILNDCLGKAGGELLSSGRSRTCEPD